MPTAGSLLPMFLILALVHFNGQNRQVQAFGISLPVGLYNNNNQIQQKWNIRESNWKRRKTYFLNLAAKSGGIMITSAEAFDNILHLNSSDKPIQLVFFTAAWCGPCRLTIPVVKEIKEHFQSQLDVYEINTDDLAEVAENCGVVSIPTIQLYHRGTLKDRIVGCVAKSVLASSVTKLLEDVSTDDSIRKHKLT